MRCTVRAEIAKPIPALAPPLLGLGWRGVAIGALYGAVYGALLSLPLARLGAK